MDSFEKGWEDNREEHLRKAYTAIRWEGKPVPLNQAVENWDNSTGEADHRYFWRALGVFRVNGALDIDQEADTTILDIDPGVSLDELEEDVELVPGDKQNVRKVEKDGYRSYGDLDVPVIPTFVAWDHVDRSGGEVFSYEDPEMRGVVSREQKKDGTSETWTGFYNHDGRKEGSTWVNQVFRGLEIEDDGELLSTEDVFTDRNRENFVESIWDKRLLKMRQRGYNVFDAAVEAVEDELPERVYQVGDRWDKEMDEIDALKREFRLMVGDREYDEEDQDYIERIVDGYYGEGLDRDSKVLQPFLENIESTPEEEGDMSYGEATRGSPTSERKKKRNQKYMEHYLDMVWQFAHEKYGE